VVEELPDGSVIMTLRVGFSRWRSRRARPGSQCLADKVSEMIETLVAAVRAGELDQVIAAQAQGKPKRRAA